MAQRKNFRDRRQQRHDEATERQAARDARGDLAQVKRLIANGHTRCREIKRLQDG